MTAMTSEPNATPTQSHRAARDVDNVVLMSGVDWSGYQTLLSLRGERPRPRMAYLDGVVELMATSRKHERVKSWTGCLVEVYCGERNLPWSKYGNWTLLDELKEAGAEPDECYIFGREPSAKDVPDLVIEVVLTSGGIDKLEIYKRLGVAEVWFWEDDRFAIYVATPTGFERRDHSEQVSGIDLQILGEHLDIEPTSDAVARYRARLRA